MTSITVGEIIDLCGNQNQPAMVIKKLDGGGELTLRVHCKELRPDENSAGHIFESLKMQEMLTKISRKSSSGSHNFGFLEAAKATIASLPKLEEKLRNDPKEIETDQLNIDSSQSQNLTEKKLIIPKFFWKECYLDCV
ncbi:hypothetical protein RFI_01283 [Reticulomyxa filosa]|uniref:Uncharacterized protein n=1 Tax=Reticulomyxa filosa TaxID=46433 RepID=X6PC74_RETFI|nr:hypothetical protein RFI_01283 [Reticulomyxa filosa]|eukprot:ETO35776.1 hypothetical protein RFI_01283 [Reticulomyxa filosa]